jgi:hypothetical protein
MDYWIQMDGNVLVSSGIVWDEISFVMKKVSHVLHLASTSIRSSLHHIRYMSGSKPKTNKITSLSVKGDHPKIDDYVFLEEVGIQQYQSLIGQLQWAILLGRFGIAVAIMTMSAFRYAPRKGHLDQVKRLCGYLSNMRHSAIRIRTEESDYSHIPRMEYDWELSVYRGGKEELQEDAPESLGKHGLLDTDGCKPRHSLAKRAKKMLHMVNQSKLQSYKTCKKYMYGFEIPRGYEDAIRPGKLHGINNWFTLSCRWINFTSTIPSMTKVSEQLIGRSSRRSEFIL